MDTRAHYDLLMDEDNDPFRDPPELQTYMDQWDGLAFLATLNLSPDKQVLKIGVGTGRLAARTAPLCARLTGIDLSPKTISLARENLAGFSNIHLIGGDFLTHPFDTRFDVVHSSLTLMHFEDKAAFLRKAASLLRPGGRLVLSLDKNQSDILDMGTRRLRIYPDTPERLLPLLGDLHLTDRFETEFAHILICQKDL